MLLRYREVLRPNKRRGVDQFVRLNSRGHAKESIHKGEPNPRAKPRESSRRNAEIREQPIRIRGGCNRELLNDERQLRFAKTIENEMRDDQIVVILRCDP